MSKSTLIFVICEIYSFKFFTTINFKYTQNFYNMNLSTFLKSINNFFNFFNFENNLFRTNLQVFVN